MTLIRFQEIYDRAVARKGGEEALLALIPQIPPADALKDQPNDRYLSAMTRAVFNAGMNWTIVGNKWAGFEDIFKGFNIDAVLSMPVEEWEAAQTDKRIIRHATKIATIAHNAQFIADIAAEHGSFGAFLAGFPPRDQIDLLALLKKRAARMGGNSAQYFLRRMGYDAFIYTRDALAALMAIGVGSGKPPTSAKAARAIQDQFNLWHDESGHSFAALSRIIACSTGDNYMHAGDAPGVKRDADGDTVIQLDEHPL